MIILASVQHDKKNAVRALLQHIVKLRERERERASATQNMFVLFFLCCNAQISEHTKKHVLKRCYKTVLYNMFLY